LLKYPPPPVLLKRLRSARRRAGTRCRCQAQHPRRRVPGPTASPRSATEKPRRRGREQGKKKCSETGEGAVAAAMEGSGGSWRWGGLAGRGVPKRQPQGVCDSTRNQLSRRGDGKNRRQALQRAGRWAVTALISFFGRVDGHRAPRPRLRYGPCLQETARGSRPPARHGRRPSPGRQTGTRAPAVPIFKAGGLERNGFVLAEILPQSVLFQSNCGKILHAKRETFQTSAI